VSNDGACQLNIYIQSNIREAYCHDDTISTESPLMRSNDHGKTLKFEYHLVFTHTNASAVTKIDKIGITQGKIDNAALHVDVCLHFDLGLMQQMNTAHMLL